jgi:enhancer of mRNA-decapping protein 3
MQEFVGLRVRLSLKSGHVMHGTVSCVSPQDQLLTLTAVEMTPGGIQTPTAQIHGHDIQDLRILKGDARESKGHQAKTREEEETTGGEEQVTSSTGARGPRRGAKGQQETKGHQGRKPGPGKRSRDSKRHPPFSDEPLAFSHDFDFQASLAKFDKKEIFKEIQELDTTPLEERLVYHNKLSSGRNQEGDRMRKLGIREMVLDDSELHDQNFLMGELNPSPHGSSELQSCATQEKRGGVFKTGEGLQVPTLTPFELLELERLACESLFSWEFGIYSR